MYWLVVAFIFAGGGAGYEQERFTVPSLASCERVGKESVDFLNKSGRLAYAGYTCIKLGE